MSSNLHKTKNFFLEANTYRSGPKEAERNLCTILAVSSRFLNSSLVARHFENEISPVINPVNPFVTKVVIPCLLSPLQFTPALRIASLPTGEYDLKGYVAGLNEFLTALISKTTYFTRSLKRFDSPVFDDSTFIDCLSKCVNLEELRLPVGPTKLGDQKACVAALPRSLKYLHCASLNDEGLQALGDSHLKSHLEHLIMNFCKTVFTPAQLAVGFAKLPHLETLELFFLKLAKQEEAQELDLWGDGKLTKIAKFNDVLINVISKLSSLRNIVLANVGFPAPIAVQDSGVESLVNLPYLTTLNLASCSDLTDASLSALFSSETCGRGTLAKVNLKSCSRLTDKSIVPLLENHASTLEALDLSYCGKDITDASLKVVKENAKNFANLKILKLDDCHGFTYLGLEWLAQLPALTSLSLSRTKANDTTITSIATSPTLKDTLKTLYVSNCKALTDVSARSLKSMNALTFVGMEGCFDINGAEKQFLRESKNPRITVLESDSSSDDDMEDW